MLYCLKYTLTRSSLFSLSSTCYSAACQMPFLSWLGGILRDLQNLSFQKTNTFVVQEIYCHDACKPCNLCRRSSIVIDISTSSSSRSNHPLHFLLQLTRCCNPYFFPLQLTKLKLTDGRKCQQEKSKSEDVCMSKFSSNSVMLLITWQLPPTI